MNTGVGIEPGNFRLFSKTQQQRHRRSYKIVHNTDQSANIINDIEFEEHQS
jgi:hypothetical protein